MSLIFGILTKQEGYEINFTPTNHKFAASAASIEKQQCSDTQAFFQSLANSNFKNNSPALARDLASGVMIIADAVIYNHTELRSLLDHNPQTATLFDSQLILKAYLKWGKDCVNRLVGEFVFAIWDPRQNYLFLARDPIGHRTLLYSLKPGKLFCFANSVQLLFEQCGIDKALHLPTLADWLAVMNLDPENTFFSSIKRLVAGHYLIIDPQKLEPVITCYWSHEAFIQNPLVLSSPAEYYAQFRQLYQQVIADRLALVDNIACDLSGGLDSSSVTCMAAYLSRPKNRTITALAHIPTPGYIKEPIRKKNYDDTPFIESVAQHYDNISLHYIRDDSKHLFEYSEQLHPLLEQPLLNPCNMLWVLACIEKAQNLGIRMILSGAMGNFTVSWNGPSFKPSSFRKKVRGYLANTRTSFYQHLQGRRSYRPWGYFSALHDDLAYQIKLYEQYHQKQEKLHKLEDPRSHSLNFNFSCSLYTAIHFLYDIHYSDPTSDQRIVEFCLRTPYHIFQNNGRSRLLVREGMGELMPQKIRERTCRGFQAADWYKKVDRQKTEIEEKLRSWQNTPIASYININYLLEKLKAWNYQSAATSSGWKYRGYEYQYRLKLLRAVETGIFLENYLK